MKDTSYHQDYWVTPDYIKACENIFNIVDSYLTRPPEQILDIGCGFAYVSELFQKKYNCKLYLLDGDVSTTTEATRIGKFGETSDFKFYLPIEKLQNHWDSKNIKYNFIDANNIKIPNDVQFDLVYSWISCGYHYPLSTYKELIKTHTNKNSTIIMDFRRKSLASQIQDLNIVSRLEGVDSSKKQKLHITLT
jgi:SAM-dependent methyltransferase